MQSIAVQTCNKYRGIVKCDISEGFIDQTQCLNTWNEERCVVHKSMNSLFFIPYVNLAWELAPVSIEFILFVTNSIYSWINNTLFGLSVKNVV